MDRFRIAIVGCGDNAKYIALGCLINRKISMAACMDIDGARARAFGRRFRIAQAFDDYGRMLDAGGIDAVYLAVPHSLHRPMIEQAVEKRLPVLCEKPIAVTLEDGMAVCRLARETGIKIGINYQYRYDPACYRLFRAAQDGALGRPLYARCNIPWHRTRDYFTLFPWHADGKASGGGTLITQASHIIDIAMLALAGEPVTAQGTTARRVFSDVEVEDLGMGIVELSNGALLSITSSMVAVPERPVTIEVYGSSGTGIYTASVFSSVRFLKASPKRYPVPAGGLHALFRSLEGFRRWVQDGIPYLIPAAASLRVLAVVEALYRSAASGRRESVDERYRRFTAGDSAV